MNDMPSAQDIKVLLADDIAEMRGILKKTLRPYGLISVDEANNGEDALEKYKLHQHSLVMLDINMPLKNGIEVLQEIKAMSPDTFIVMVSADSTAENLKNALASGVNGFLVKPYSTAKVDGIINKLNQHRLATDPSATPLKAHSNP
jgi:two-component system chemotaxis response regulator CheY